MMNLLKLLLLICALASCEKAVKPERPLPAVSTAKVVKENVPVYVDSIGQVIPTITVQIRPQVGGKLITTYIKQGDEVKENQLLYEIDPRPFKAALEQAQAQLKKNQALLSYAKKTEERYAKVVEEDYISKLAFEQYQSNTLAATSQVAADEAAVKQAKINLEFTKIYAPVAGKISSFVIDVGNVVVADDPTAITVIRPHSYVDIAFAIPQHQFELVRRFQGDHGEWKFIATLPESPQNPHEGTSFFINNELSADTGTILIKGQVPNFERKLWPGEYVKVKLLQNVAENAKIVPPGTVLIGKDGPYVYVLNSDNTVSVKQVKVIYRSEEFIAVDSEELKENDTVITDGQINIAPGTKVNVVK
jgi:multidrug efflux system membrane fusion protein